MSVRDAMARRTAAVVRDEVLENEWNEDVAALDDVLTVPTAISSSEAVSVVLPSPPSPPSGGDEWSVPADEWNEDAAARDGVLIAIKKFKVDDIPTVPIAIPSVSSFSSASMAVPSAPSAPPALPSAAPVPILARRTQVEAKYISSHLVFFFVCCFPTSYILFLGDKLD
jgi:hypothetical protein